MVDDCLNRQEADGLCSGHYKRRQLDKPVYVALRKAHESPLERLREASITRENADTEGDEEAFARADDNLRKAAIAYAVSLGRVHVLVEVAHVEVVRVRRPPPPPPVRQLGLAFA